MCGHTQPWHVAGGMQRAAGARGCRSGWTEHRCAAGRRRTPQAGARTAEHDAAAGARAVRVQQLDRHAARARQEPSVRGRGAKAACRAGPCVATGRPLHSAALAGARCPPLARGLQGLGRIHFIALAAAVPATVRPARCGGSGAGRRRQRGLRVAGGSRGGKRRRLLPHGGLQQVRVDQDVPRGLGAQQRNVERAAGLGLGHQVPAARRAFSARRRSASGVRRRGAGRGGNRPAKPLRCGLQAPPLLLAAPKCGSGRRAVAGTASAGTQRPGSTGSLPLAQPEQGQSGGEPPPGAAAGACCGLQLRPPGPRAQEAG